MDISVGVFGVGRNKALGGRLCLKEGRKKIHKVVTKVITRAIIEVLV